jgi:hypothetical protein
MVPVRLHRAHNRTVQSRVVQLHTNTPKPTTHNEHEKKKKEKKAEFSVSHV